MPVKVSVIVPVYNPGPYIEDCAASLLRQSLPADAYEVIFVDDGSTDATPARLDALAAAHPHVRVLHQENSGWSGRPRNVGIEASRGEFVMFVDNDDVLGDEALERMYDYGVAHGADAVVGKMAGKGRPVPVEPIRGALPVVAQDVPARLPGPHRSALPGGPAAPGGPRLRHRGVSARRQRLGAQRLRLLLPPQARRRRQRRFPALRPGRGYFKNLREALDVVERYTEPGPGRDRLPRRWLRVEIADRMSGRRLLALPDDYRREVFRETHAVVVERFGPGAAPGLRPGRRIVAALIREDRYDDLVALAGWEAGVRPRAVPAGVTWQGGALRVDLTAEYGTPDGPLTVPAGAARPAADGAPGDLAEAVSWPAAAADEGFDRATVDLVVRDRDSGASFFQPVEVTRERVPAADGGTRSGADGNRCLRRAPEPSFGTP